MRDTADATLQIDIIANDRASAVISGIRNDVGRLGSSASGISRAGTSIKNFGENLDKATKPLQVASLGIIAAGAASTKAAIDFEKNFAAVKKTVDGTPEQLEAVKKGIIDLTTVGIGGRSALPATTAELNAIAAAAGQLGIKTENIVEFTEIMAQMGSATNLAGEQGAATLARLMNVTNTDQGLIRNMGSSIVELGNNFETTEAEIAAMAMRMGSTATIVGMSIQDVLGFSTALSSLGIEAEAGGSAFSRILMSISTAVSSGGKELNEFAKTAGMSAKDFAKAWKSDATGAFTEFLKGLSENEDIIAKLEDLGFGNIRDITGLQNLSGAKGIELVTQALKMSNEAWSENTALQKEADAMAQTLAGQLTITKNNITKAERAFGEAIMPTVAEASEKVKELAQGLSEMDSDEIDTTVKALAGFATVGVAVKGVAGLATALGALCTPIGAVTAGIVALSVATPIIVDFFKEWEEHSAAMEQLAAEEAAAAEEFAQSRANWQRELGELSEMEAEITELGIVIKNDASSEEEVATAKARLEEIAAYLEQEYGIKIETDNSALDTTISKLRTAIAYRNDLLSGAYSLSKLTSLPQPSQGGFNWTSNAKGTQNFPGGLAMVNDQTGISDNRELIIDRGHAFIPQGRNVLLPLSRGAKVYTAAQTKAIMSALGVPMYASGKDNSDGFITARDNLTHRKSTSAMSVTDELAEWVKLSEQFKSNQRDVWDIQEQIFSLTRKQTDELNKQSEAYIATRTALSDWEIHGDDPISAYNRVKERNLKELEAGRLTWDEYSDTMYAFGEKMLNDRIAQSEEWIAHQKKYCNMSAEEEMAAYQRIQAYTLQYYEQGLINLETFNAAASRANEKYLDANTQMLDDQYSAWEKSMDNWINMRETYGDWDEFGDSLSQTYARAIVRQEEFYNAGLISWQEKEDAKLEYSLEMYKAASDEYDAVLAEQSEYISEMRDKFAAEEAELRSSWEVKDRSTDLAEVERLLSIYKNAATDAGQEKYKELLEQKEQLEREERLYQLQVDNNATLDKLQAEYDKMEANKKNVLARLKVSSSDIASTNADISAEVESTRQIANEIGLVYSRAAESTLDSLGEVVNLLEGIKKALGGRSTNTYNDNKKVTINSGISEAGIFKAINGVLVGSIENIF